MVWLGCCLRGEASSEVIDPILKKLLVPVGLHLEEAGVSSFVGAFVPARSVADVTFSENTRLSQNQKDLNHLISPGPTYPPTKK